MQPCYYVCLVYAVKLFAYLIAYTVLWYDSLVRADIDASFDPPGWLKFEGDHFVVLCRSRSDDEDHGP